MTVGRLVFRSIRAYWRTGVVVVFGLLIATAVITGSLVIGDSVRGSLRDTALSRLGMIDHALVSPTRYFDADLAARLKDHAPSIARAAAILSTRGAVRNTETDATVPEVEVLGVPEGFWGFFEGAQPGLTGRECALNTALAADLNISVGQAVVVTAHRQSEIDIDTLFAQRGRQETAPSLRLTVARIIEADSGNFRLDAQNATPRNLFVSRRWLAERLDLQDRANVIITRADAAQNGKLQTALKEAATLADHGLTIDQHPGRGYLSLTTEATVLNNRQVQAAESAARECGCSSRRVSVYLANTIDNTQHPGAEPLAYAMIAALEPLPEFAFRSQPPRTESIGERQIWLNTWAARDLGASVGDTLTLTYMLPTSSGDYPTDTIGLTVGAIVQTSGFGADEHLVPDFPGITEAETVGDWEAPFPVDMSLITDRDEEYWHTYRAAPKAFVHPSVVQQMWQSGPRTGQAGWVTSVLISPPADRSVTTAAGDFRNALLEALPPSASGLAFRPVRKMALEASKGTSDFSQLFLGLSMFLVFAGAGLGGMLLTLSVQRRSSQAGIMEAVGCPADLVGRVLFVEGATLAVIGTVLGVPAGMAYASGIIGALNTWWSGALGRTGNLWFHWTPLSIAIGGVSGIIIGLAVVWLSIRRLHRQRTLQLLRGGQRTQTAPSPGRRRFAGWSLVVLIIIAGALAILSMAADLLAPQMAFFGIGFVLLLAVLAAARLVLSSAVQSPGANASLLRLAVRNSAANPARSLLVIGLIAAATFTIVAVAANSRDMSKLDVDKKESGTGGFELRATASVPLPFDPSTPGGRRRLGFSPEDEAALKGTTIISCPISPGEDISCLNIARPQHPRMLGVPEKLIRRGGFSPRTTTRSSDGWEALQADLSEAIPAFGDSTSVRWTLHSSLGGTYTMPGPEGQELKMRFVGVLPGSIFQSELLVSEQNFERIYPSIDSPAYFLIDTPEGKAGEVGQVLRANLGQMGLQVRPSAEVLNDFLRVQNTYLSMFLALGGLGLLLGTVGLIAVLLRSALERRAELALMLATGFGRARIALLLVAENGGLLVAGMMAGAVCALIAVGPQIISASSAVNWRVLVAVLSGILFFGLAGCAAAAYGVVRGALIPALREQ